MSLVERPAQFLDLPSLYRTPISTMAIAFTAKQNQVAEDIGAGLSWNCSGTNRYQGTDKSLF